MVLSHCPLFLPTFHFSQIWIEKPEHWQKKTDLLYSIKDLVFESEQKFERFSQSFSKQLKNLFSQNLSFNSALKKIFLGERFFWGKARPHEATVVMQHICYKTKQLYCSKAKINFTTKRMERVAATTVASCGQALRCRRLDEKLDSVQQPL